MIDKSRHKPALITGRQPLIEALRSGHPLERIFLLRNAVGENVRVIQTLARERGIPVNMVPVEKLNRMTRVNHQGCIGIAALVQYHDLQDVISFVVEKGETPLFLLADGITDVRNIGAMARSAVCCGAQALILAESGVAPLNEEAMKASAGALEHLLVCRVRRLPEAAATLRLNGIRLLAADMRGKQELQACDWTGPAAVVLGAEDQGVDPVLLQAADSRFRIPMAEGFDSFNVSVATGIILYEALQQRRGIRRS